MQRSTSVAIVGLLLLGLSIPSRAQQFKDVTEASGVNAIQDAGYAASPKWWLSGIDLVDLDGDGKFDLFLSAHGGGPAVMALGDGKGHFTAAPPSDNLPPTEMHLGYDLNEDGLVDLQMTYRDGGGKWWMNHSTPGHLNFTATNIDLDGGQARQNAMIDINRDGLVDWMHEGPREGKFYTTVYAKGDGKGGLSEVKTPLIKPGWTDGESMIPVDLNGDGFIDLIMSKRGYEDERNGASRIYLNDGKGNFTDATTACGITEVGTQIMGVGDFANHGALDLICLEHGHEVTVYLNDGKGHFTKVPNAITGGEHMTHPADANWGMAVAVDLDNDGITDVLVNGRNFLYVLKGTGGGHFTYVNKLWGIDDYSDAAVDAGICFGDIDGDGMLDLLGYKSVDYKDQRRVKVYHNELPKQNYINVRPVGLPGNRGAAGAKVRVFEPGGMDDLTKLVEYDQIAIWARQVCHSYYTYAQTERHFGLGARQTVDVSIEFYPSGKIVRQKGVKANQTILIPEEN